MSLKISIDVLMCAADSVWHWLAKKKFKKRTKYPTCDCKLIQIIKLNTCYIQFVLCTVLVMNLFDNAFKTPIRHIDRLVFHKDNISLFYSVNKCSGSTKGLLDIRKTHLHYLYFQICIIKLEIRGRSAMFSRQSEADTSGFEQRSK